MTENVIALPLPARRHVPLSVALRVMVGQAGIGFGLCFGLWLAFGFWLFPLTDHTSWGVSQYLLTALVIPAFTLAIGLTRGCAALRLLKYGTLVMGRVVAVVDTGERRRGRAIVRIACRFTAEDGRSYEVYANTTAGTREYVKMSSQQGQVPYCEKHPHQLTTHELAAVEPAPVAYEPLLYHPAYPAEALAGISLPGNMYLDDDGQVRVG
ncbi:MAG: hypothetical protein ACYDBB_22935 [Armatimonadota bacterium]